MIWLKIITVVLVGATQLALWEAIAEVFVIDTYRWYKARRAAYWAA